MKKIFFIAVTAIGMSSLAGSLRGQSLPVGMPVLEDYYRRLQLLGGVEGDVSFTVRPLEPASLKRQDVYDPDSTLAKDGWFRAGQQTFAGGRGLFRLLPLSWQQQYNTDHPYGWNDGPMIPAKGYQTLVSGGIFVKFGPLSVQLRPEFVYAANPKFEGFASVARPDENLVAYYNYHNQIDWPERYGGGSYSKAFWGQSSIRLTFDPVSVGLSSENVWWGPGIRNSLILSNNAPGFKHLTINTVRPVKTFIGSFEGQILAGRLDASGFPPLVTTAISTGRNLYIPKTDDWRYFAGLNINYHIRWVPGLTLGLTRTFDAYHEDVKTFSEYIPFFFPYQKQNTNNGDPIPRDQYTSLYARWLFPQAQAEFYFEYGLNDNTYNFHDFIGSPDHSRAYILGLRKILPFGNHVDQHILVGAEITQLSQSPDRLVRDAEGWYQHGAVRDGQTNQGQILGAGTGSGGNLQSMEVSWVSGLKKLGVSIERYEHNVDFSNNAFPDINGNSRKWVDLAFALQGEWNYKNLLFNARLEEIKSLNYEWLLQDYTPGEYYIPHNDAYNLHCVLGVTFRF